MYRDVYNKYIVKDLEKEINANLVLITVDGFTIFGNLRRVECRRIAIFTPATVCLACGGAVTGVTYSDTTRSAHTGDLYPCGLVDSCGQRNGYRCRAFLRERSYECKTIC